jgi:cytochrome b
MTSPSSIRPAPGWDLPVRIAHWLLVLGVAGSWITHYAGPAWFAWHRRCGYAVLVIVLFRIAWGFVGSAPARFAQFVRGPRAIAAWLRARSPPQPGHNPLGALSVVAMLALLLVQAMTGLFANDEIASAGPFYGWVSHELSNRLSRLHRANENWLLGLIVLHLAAVAWYVLVRRRPLLRAMITGALATASTADAEQAGGATLRRALLIAVGLAALLAALLWLAPESVPVLF